MEIADRIYFDLVAPIQFLNGVWFKRQIDVFGICGNDKFSPCLPLMPILHTNLLQRRHVRVIHVRVRDKNKIERRQFFRLEWRVNHPSRANGDRTNADAASVAKDRIGNDPRPIKINEHGRLPKPGEREHLVGPSFPIRLELGFLRLLMPDEISLKRKFYDFFFNTNQRARNFALDFADAVPFFGCYCSRHDSKSDKSAQEGREVQYYFFLLLCRKHVNFLSLITRYSYLATRYDMNSFFFSANDGIARVKFARPETLNSLTFKVYRDLADLFYKLRTADDVKVVLLEGNGRGFCSGGDVHEIIGELLKRDVKGLLDFTRMSGELIANMRTLEKPIISAVNGIAAGAGAVIALASDFRIFAKEAKIAFLFQKVGLTGADMGAVFLLPKLVGLARATEMLMLGDTISSEQAEKIGLANKVVAIADLENESLALAKRLSKSATLALGLTKRLLNNEWNMDLASAIEQEATAQALMMQTRDHREFHEAFSQKREPKFEGR